MQWLPSKRAVCRRNAFFVALIVALILFAAASAGGQVVQAPPGIVPVQPPASVEPAEPQPIPFAQISSESEALQPWLRQANTRLEPPPEIITLEKQLVSARERLLLEVNAAHERLSEHPSIATLDDMLGEWRGRNQRVTLIRSEVTRRAQELGALLANAAAREKVWRTTLDLTKAEGIPSDVVETVRVNISSLASLTERLGRRRGELLSLIDQVSRAGTAIEALIAEILSSIDMARGRLFERDSPPITTIVGDLRSEGRALPDQVKAELSQDAGALIDFFREDSRSLVWSLLIFVGMLPLTFALRLHVRRRLSAGQELEGPVEVFGRPIAIAVLAGLLGAFSLLGNAPSLATKLTGLLTLAPLARLLLPILRPVARPALVLVGLLYVVDRARLLVDSVAIVERGLLLFEAGGTATLAVALLRSTRWREILASLRFGQIVQRVMQIALGVLFVSFVANLAGYLGLARLLWDGLLTTLFVAIVVYAIDRVATTGLLVVISSDWAQRSGVVRAAGPMIVRISNGLIWIVLGVIAASTVLRSFLIDRQVFDGVSAIVLTPLEIGEVSI